MHERNGAQLVCLAALGAVNCLFSAAALAFRGSTSPALGIAGALVVATGWMIWLGALRSWMRSVRVAGALDLRA